MTRKNIAFVTGHQFGVQALKGMRDSSQFQSGEIDVPLIIGLPHQFQRRTVGFESIETLADQWKLSYVEAVDPSLQRHAAAIAEHEIDILLVVGWSYLVPYAVRSMVSCRYNDMPLTIGMHPSPLPIGRGRAPIPWTILNGLSTTALSVFILADTADSGPIIEQYPVTISSEETSGTLYQKFLHKHYIAGLELSATLVDGISMVSYQDEAVATVWPKRTPSDSELKRSFTRDEAFKLFRAQTDPYPNVYVKYENGCSKVIDMRDSKPKKGDDWREIRVADGALWLKIENIDDV